MDGGVRKGEEDPVGYRREEEKKKRGPTKQNISLTLTLTPSFYYPNTQPSFPLPGV